MDSPLQLKQLQLKIAVPPELEIYADTNMLKTIIRNLLSNAIKYSLPKGLIVIEAATTGKYSKITVSDSGIGMSPEIRSKIFRIDEHISNPGTANETGSGLGLILCKDFINRHQGQVSVESEPGKGCTFTLLFPAEHVRKISGNL
jgi:signal transduction histidine kinase